MNAATYKLKLENLFLNFVYELRKDADRNMLRELDKIPMEILRATFVAGGMRGLKVALDAAKEDTP